MQKIRFLKPIFFSKLSLLFFCFCVFSLQAQKSSKKPKIGLVLSGGGAKGFAHIGVLKIIDSLGIKIDYIGGTSMGAVVGGLYASGYNAVQIDSIVNTTNFDNLIIDYIPRSAKSFYEKNNDERYALVLPFKKMKIGVPQSLSKGMFNYNLFNRLTLHVRHERDFSKFPIPFICLATDIECGEQVVMSKGVLSQSLSASSALPSIFSPVVLNDRFLIDGGILNNYPIDEVRAMGADIIIGVDVQSGLKSREELNDGSKIVFQIFDIEMSKKMERVASKTDIYIKPDIKDYGAVSFEKAVEIIKKGEQATFEVLEKLKKLNDPLNFYRKPKLKLASDSLNIKNIVCNGLRKYTKEYVIGKLQFRPGQKISIKDIEKGISIIDATHNFGAVSYSLEPNVEADDLILNLTENDINLYLKFGLHYDELYKSNALVNLTKKYTFFKNDIASFDFILGDNSRFNFDYYVDNGYNLSFGVKSQLNKFNRNLTQDVNNLSQIPFNNLNSINIDYLDVYGQAYFQTIFARKFLVGGGIENRFVSINSQTVNSNKKALDRGNYTSVFGYIKYDNLDNKYFTTKGWSFDGCIHNYLLTTENTNTFNPFTVAKADFIFAFKPLKKISLKTEFEGGLTIGNNGVAFFDFYLGGYGTSPLANFKPFYGYNFLSLSGNSYLKGAATFDCEIFKKNHINVAVNVANIGDNIFESLELISLPKYSGYALGYGIETILGPLEIKHSWSPDTNKNYTWLSLGFWF